APHDEWNQDLVFARAAVLPDVAVAPLAGRPVEDARAAVHLQRHVADALGEAGMRVAAAVPAFLGELHARAHLGASAQPVGGALHELALAPGLHVAERGAALA